MLKRQTAAEMSSNKFDVAEYVSGASVDGVREVIVDELLEYDRVTVVVKVVQVDDVMEVAGGKKKQDVIVSDKSKSCRVTIWEDEIDKLKVKKTYKLSGTMIRTFGHGNDRVTYLSTGKQGEVVDDRPRENQP